MSKYSVMRYVWSVSRLLGWCVSLLLPGQGMAQVVMDVPFVPIGGTYVPVVDATDPIQAEYTFQGKDENGADIFATEWVEIDPAEWQDSVDAAVQRPGTTGIRALIADGGMTVDPQAGDGLRIMNPLEGAAWSHLGTCHRGLTHTDYLGTPATETMGSCIELIAAYWGPPYYGLTNDPSKYVYDMSGSCRTGSWHIVQSPVTTGGFHANESGCFPEPTIPVPEPTPLTQGQSMELLQDPPPGPGETDWPEPVSRPVTNNEFTTIINNNKTNITNLTTVSTTLTTSYETDGDVADLPNPSTERPPGVPSGGASGSEDMSAFCAESPGVLMCQDAEDLSGIEDVNAEIAEGLDGLLSTAEGYLSSFDEYEIGDGPVLGPSPGACPIAGGWQVEGTDTVIDTDVFCETIGGVGRTFVLISAVLIAAFILYRGLSD